MSDKQGIATRAIGLIVLVVLMGGFLLGYLFYQNRYIKNTSDAKDLTEVTIALDSWIGYYMFQSQVFKKKMREAGYRIKIIDDQANYPERMKNLKNGTVDFATCTVDAYLLNGKEENFPATIISVIDLSNGGDAVVAWEDKVSTIDDLKNFENLKIAYTPDSPSHHLLKSIESHFGIEGLSNKNLENVVQTNGAEDAYKKLVKKEVDVAVIWEPYVTRSSSQKGIKKILGSENINVITDILLVNRKVSSKDPELVELVLKNYFQALEHYSQNNDDLKEEIKRSTKTSMENVDSMLQGVRWLAFNENTQFLGISTIDNYYNEQIIQDIESTVRILMESGDFDTNPLPGEDPFSLVNSSFMNSLYTKGAVVSNTDSTLENSVEKKFSPLSDDQWEKLQVVGSLKLRPLTFVSGTTDLDNEGQQQLDIIVETIKRYPNFRILIKGHTGLRGNPEENMQLSLERAEAVKVNFADYYKMDLNRLRAIGMGNTAPLEKGENESKRAYERRLKRVEIIFLTL